MPSWLFWVIVIGFGLFLFDRWFLWMEEKGWIYWRKKGGSSSPGNALIAMDAIFQPGKRYVLEQKQKEMKECADEEDEAGDKKP
jgi:hypothetical protein